MEHLIPCPFCGSTDLSLRGNEEAEYTNGKMFAVQCNRCGARGPEEYLARESAKMRWNARHKVSA